MSIYVPGRLTLRKEYIGTDDADAAAYIAAVEAADLAADPTAEPLETATKVAIHSFVKGCKADGIWPAIKASCILAGARTLNGALVPLAGAAPTNNGPFVGGDYDRKTGLGQQGSSSKWLNSNYLNSADTRQNNNHQAVFTHSYDVNAFLLGNNFGTGGSTATALSAQSSSFGNVWNMSPSSDIPITSVLQNGKLFGSARQASGSYTARVNGDNYTVNRASVTPGAGTIGLFRLSATSDFASSTARIQFYSIGNFLNLALLDARVTDLINAFGAAIP